MGLEPWANQHDYCLIYEDVEQGFNPGLERDLEPWANQHDYRLIYDDVEQGFNPGPRTGMFLPWADTFPLPVCPCHFHVPLDPPPWKNNRCIFELA